MTFARCGVVDPRSSDDYRVHAGYRGLARPVALGLDAIVEEVVQSGLLVYMANQIGKFFASQGPDKAVAGTAEHIKNFWDPQMREAIFQHLDAGGQGLDTIPRQPCKA